MAAIVKAARIEGNTLAFRNADVSDAEFILSLRTDAVKSRYLSQTSAQLSDQTEWLEAYANRSDEAYFIIESLSGDRLGTVRLYDSRGDSFCWGSWIVKDGAPRPTAVESALMVYAYAVDFLGFTNCHFDVRKENEQVCRFHERFGAVRTGETKMDYLYTLSGEAIAQARHQFSKFLPNDLRVVQS